MFYFAFLFALLKISLIGSGVFGVHVRSHRNPLLKGHRAKFAHIRLLVGVNPYVSNQSVSAGQSLVAMRAGMGSVARMHLHVLAEVHSVKEFSFALWAWEFLLFFDYKKVRFYKDVLLFLVWYMV